MRRVWHGFFSLAALSLAAALLTAGCGGSASVTGPDDEPQLATGAAVVHGTIVGSGVAASSIGVHAFSNSSGLTVSVAGTAVSCPVDDEGQFTLAGLPAGQVTLQFEGPGVSAQLTLTGLVDGQILSVVVQVSGSTAQLAAPPASKPTVELRLNGTIESINGDRLVVSSRRVDGSTARKIWRGDVRIQLSDLKVGDKVIVSGTLKSDGVVAAYEIEAEGPITNPGWVTFRGIVESVGMSSLDLHANPTGGGGSPWFIISGKKVRTDGGTKFKWSDRTALDPSQVRAGDKAYVEGWKKSDGSVLAAKLVVDCR